MKSNKEIAYNITDAVIEYLTAYHDEEADNDLDLRLDLVREIEQHLLSIEDKELGTNKFAIRKEWSYIVKTNSSAIAYTTNDAVQGFECGYSYIAHYAINLFKEMCDKRWAPKSRLGQVNTLASQFIKAGKASDKSTAMKLASQRIKRQTTMHGKSIVEDMNILVDTIDMKQSDAIRAYYPSLMVNMVGEHRGRPKDLHVRLIAKLVMVIATVTGYN